MKEMWIAILRSLYTTKLIQMNKRSLILFLAIASCNNVAERDMPREATIKQDYISIDSALIEYDTFDITKDCFDCNPYVLISFSEKENFRAPIDTMNIIAVSKHYPNDTIHLIVDSLGIERGRIKFVATFYTSQLNACGYYETARLGYRILNEAEFYYYTSKADDSLKKITKGSSYKVRVQQQEFIPPPPLPN